MEIPVFFRRYGAVLYLALVVFLGCTTTFVYSHMGHITLLTIANYIGPVADSILSGRGVSFCQTEHGATNCFFVRRMPLPPLAAAILYRIFGDHYLAASLFKTIACLVPALVAFLFAWRWASLGGHIAQFRVWLLMILAVCLPPALNLVGSMNSEEAYFYGWMALAFGLTIFPEGARRRPVVWSVALFFSLALTYLSKSSMLGMVVILGVFFAGWLFRSLHLRALAVAFLLCVMAVPVLWGVRWKHITGRFTVGTSLDGMNLYKGNNATFLDHYPLPGHGSLDQYDGTVLVNNPTEEWLYDDYFSAAAKRYILKHPADVLRGEFRKAYQVFIGIKRFGGGDADSSYPWVIETSYSAGLLLFRIMLIVALGFAVFRAVTRSGSERFAAICFIGGAAGVILPYIVGFYLTRHTCVLILPAGLYLSRIIGGERILAETTAADDARRMVMPQRLRTQ